MADETTFPNTDFIAIVGRVVDWLLFKYCLGEATKPSIPWYSTCLFLLEHASIVIYRGICNSCRKAHSARLKHSWLRPNKTDSDTIDARYDLSEPQFGKDVCDRVISPLKGAIRRYCNEGHDVISAADIHRALKARQFKGCTAAVCELDRTGLEIKVNRIPNFSTFHNFSYEEDGLRMWKAYDIGQGKFLSWSDLYVQVPSTIALQSAGDDLQFWVDVQPRTMELKKESDTEAQLFECNESGCSHTFQSYEALQDH
ncbi:uncharacterized protein [Montipora capricornis]|uniref:uncharacterized protein n=1 Tax=Montipora capricornis TaxID=246305 RepID=UPI0035F2112A